MRIEPRLLGSYLIDRAPGATLNGPAELVVLVLRTTDGAELACAFSKVDAIEISSKLRAAAYDASGIVLPVGETGA